MSITQLYRLEWDSGQLNQWHLGRPRTIGDVPLVNGGVVRDDLLATAPGVVVPIYQEGDRLDISFATGDIPVAVPRVANLVAERAGDDVRVIPAQVEGAPGQFFALWVKNSIDCIDPERTIGTFWPDSSERAGQYRMIVDLKLRPDAAGDHQIFRVKGWEVAIIVTERLKAEVEGGGATGVLFLPAS
ncbi:MAG TPA: DUF1629 domain-containing protein [Acidimicrobiales bacterium]|nr:DUF1629 domain-containing protein [Acidimicrobiales bacterium]